MSEPAQYLYLDSKIVGTAKQIAGFFRQGIFTNTATVLVKHYKHRSNKEITKIFEQSDIPFRIVKNSDLDQLPCGTVFYPFNAQSNVRFVANRRLTHIFITHGESNKVSSVKPILRIYDYVVTAGDAGIDRLLQHKIFSEYDAAQGRLKKMGDAFIGRTGLGADGERVIFYAPTWEGGVVAENYSSLRNIDAVADYLLQACRLYACARIVIRPHPNTGHRLPEYRRYLQDLAKRLAKSAAVSLFCGQLSLGFWEKWQLKKCGVALVADLSRFRAAAAFCDVSAMETQLLNEEIPYYLLNSRQENLGLLYKQHNHIYKRILINLFNPMVKLEYMSASEYQNLKSYVISQNNTLSIKELSKLTRL